MMPSVTYLANPHSVHVQRWLELARKAGITVRGITVEPAPLAANEPWERFGVGPGAMRYWTAGLRLRTSSMRHPVVHAHNASGYGLLALLSGRRYILTVYGSEIYDAPNRGRLYTWLITRVLHGAERITCTSPAMQQHLMESFRVPEERIDVFSLGISMSVFRFSAEERRRARERLGFQTDKVLLSNRRMRPLYRTEMLLHAFGDLITAGKDLHLVLLEGDSIPDYVSRIERQVESMGLQRRVTIVRGFRAPEEVRQYILASDAVVSIPETDQLSASILEAIACGSSVGVSNLPDYQDLFAARMATGLRTGSTNALRDDLEILLSTPRTDADRVAAAEWVSREHSDESVLPHLKGLYAGVGG